MKTFIVKYIGAYLSGYVAVCAKDSSSALAVLTEKGFEFSGVPDIKELDLWEGETHVIFDGDY